MTFFAKKSDYFTQIKKKGFILQKKTFG